MSSVGILIVDDHPAVRAGLKQLISSRPGWLICGEAGNGEEAIAKALEVKPSAIVMDISMPWTGWKPLAAYASSYPTRKF